MKKIIIFSILVTTAFLVFLGVVLANSDSKIIEKETKQINEVFGKIIPDTEYLVDTPLSKVDLGEGVTITWKSHNANIAIIEKSFQNTYDTAAQQYYFADVTLGTADVVGKLDATIKYGSTSITTSYNTRVLGVSFATNSTELSAIQDGKSVQITATLTEVKESTYGNFQPTFTFSDGTTFIGYRISDDFLAQFKALLNKEVKVLAEKSSYNGTAQLKNVVEIIEAV